MRNIYSGNSGSYIKVYLVKCYSSKGICAIFLSISGAALPTFRSREKTVDSFFTSAGALSQRNIILFNKISNWILRDIDRKLETERNVNEQNALLDIHQSLTSVFLDESTKLKKELEEQLDKNVNVSFFSDKPCSENVPKIAIITALQDEFLAVEQSLDTIHSLPQKPSIKFSYVLGEIKVNSGKSHQVVLVKTNMGNNLAAVRATRVLAEFPSVETIVMCGVAGGVPNLNSPHQHVRLGDVVYSDWNGIRQFDMRVLDEITDNKRPPDPKFIDAVEQLSISLSKSFKQLDDDIDSICKNLMIKRPKPKSDILIDYEGNILKHPIRRDGRSGKPRVFGGAIASSNELLKNPRIRDRLGKECSAKAIEMEAAGVADACYEHSKGCFIVRGISDYCDMGKTKIWQPYAAVTAAAYLKNCIRLLVI